MIGKIQVGDKVCCKDEMVYGRCISRNGKDGFTVKWEDGVYSTELYGSYTIKPVYRARGNTLISYADLS